MESAAGVEVVVGAAVARAAEAIVVEAARVAGVEAAAAAVAAAGAEAEVEADRAAAVTELPAANVAGAGVAPDLDREVAAILQRNASVPRTASNLVANRSRMASAVRVGVAVVAVAVADRNPALDLVQVLAPSLVPVRNPSRRLVPDPALAAEVDPDRRKINKQCTKIKLLLTIFIVSTRNAKE